MFLWIIVLAVGLTNCEMQETDFLKLVKDRSKCKSGGGQRLNLHDEQSISDSDIDTKEKCGA